MLEAMCTNADHVLIGLGSSNKYNLRNPFTVEESAGMIRTYLSSRFSNYEFITVPDFGHLQEHSDGNKWKEYVKEHFGTLDYFISGNEYVSALLKDTYPVIHPAELVDAEELIKIRATAVRLKMARGDDWQSLVPMPVVNYLEEKGLVDRFKSEFGLQAINAALGSDGSEQKSYQQEQDHSKEK